MSFAYPDSALHSDDGLESQNVQYFVPNYSREEFVYAAPEHDQVMFESQKRLVNEEVSNSSHLFEKPKNEQESCTKETKSKEKDTKIPKKRAAVKSKLKVGESLALRRMERFACVMFCVDCQGNADYDGSQLTMKLCKRCCTKIDNFKV